jgi:hypothetical protein
MTAQPTSASFPNGLPPARLEAEVRSLREAKKEVAKCCPFCGEDPLLAQECRPGWYTVGCTSDECKFCPQVTAMSLAEAWRHWNTRARS